MYRKEPSDGNPDSGWRFLSGNEDEKYIDNPNNHHIFAINTICNYDKDIIPYLKSKIRSTYIRISHSEFAIDDDSKPIFVDKQDI